MCYEFDEFYRRAREAEETRKRKLADESRKQDESSAPAKPAAPGKGVERKEPVPA
jgi:hypothetical protein